MKNKQTISGSDSGRLSACIRRLSSYKEGIIVLALVSLLTFVDRAEGRWLSEVVAILAMVLGTVERIAVAYIQGRR
jgi:hypothetical protein